MRTRYQLFMVIVLMITGVQGVALAQDADAVLGKWYTENNRAVVEITKSGNVYSGRIISLKEPLDKEGKPKVDTKNPDEKKRSQPMIGIQFLVGFTFQGDQWSGGTIYDPESGNSYSSKMYFKGADLEVRGYVLGLPFLGRSQIWTRGKK